MTRILFLLMVTMTFPASPFEAFMKRGHLDEKMVNYRLALFTSDKEGVLEALFDYPEVPPQQAEIIRQYAFASTAS